MPKKIAGFEELSASLSVCTRMRSLLETYGFLFSPPRFELIASYGMPHIVLGAKKELPHKDSTAAQVIVGAWLERGDKFEPMITICDLGSPEDDRVIFTLLNGEWVMTIHSLPETPPWFSDLVDVLMARYGSDPDMKRGVFSWAIPVFEAAIETAVRTLKSS